MEILYFGQSNNSAATTMSYELFAYQNHPDYTRTIACCNASSYSPAAKNKSTEVMSKMFLHELIELQTLEKWIEGNSLQLNTSEKYQQLNNVTVIKGNLMMLVHNHQQYPYRNPFKHDDTFLRYNLEHVDSMQADYLAKFEPGYY